MFRVDNHILIHEKNDVGQWPEVAKLEVPALGGPSVLMGDAIVSWPEGDRSGQLLIHRQNSAGAWIPTRVHLDLDPVELEHRIRAIAVDDQRAAVMTYPVDGDRATRPGQTVGRGN